VRCQGRLGGGMRGRRGGFDGADDDEFACVCEILCVDKKQISIFTADITPPSIPLSPEYGRKNVN
jgi:hypothetical protein